MALRTAIGFAEEVLNQLRDQLVGRDIQIDLREIILSLDQMVNEEAKNGFFENWKIFNSTSVDEMYLTRWEWITVTDPTNKGASFFQIPAHYAVLPYNEGINQVYFSNDFTLGAKKKYFDPVIITSFQDVSANRNTVGEFLEGRISCYPRNGNMYFDRGQINAKYGQVGIALVVRDASAIASDAPYPIPADKQSIIINKLVAMYRMRLAQPQDNIKDATSVESK